MTWHTCGFTPANGSPIYCNKPVGHNGMHTWGNGWTYTRA